MEVEGPEFFNATSYYHALTYLLKKSTQKGPRKVTKGKSSNADDDMPNLTPSQFEELFESAGDNVSEGYERAPIAAEQDVDPFYADDPD